MQPESFNPTFTNYYLKIHRIVAMFGVVMLPAFGLLYRWQLPGVVDPWWERLGLALLCLLFVIFSFAPWFKKHSLKAAYGIIYLGSIWEFHVIYLNDLQIDLVVGQFVLVVACSIAFVTNRPLIIYAIGSLIITAIISANTPGGQMKPPLYLFSLTTIISLLMVILYSRNSLIKNLSEARLQAEAANQAKREFLSHITHEIRTPLSTIDGANLLLKDTSLSPQQKELSGLISTSSFHLMELVNETLDLTKIEAGEMSLESIAFDIEDLLEKSVGHLALTLMKKSTKIDLDTSGLKLTSFMGDPTRIRQIIFNLISNAIKFTPRGLVHVMASSKELGENKFEISISVKDSGVGMSENTLKNIFEEYIQANTSTYREYGGTGLGLPISRKLARKMNGDITVESKPNIGTTFTLVMVLNNTPEGARAGNNELENIQRTYHKKVLLVDDNPLNLSVTSRILEKMELEVTTALKGALAVKLAAEAKYDLILMDIQMPEMDGVKTTMTVRQGEGPNQNTPIIALTGDVGDKKFLKYHSAGMNGYLTKPIRIQTLVSELDRHLLQKTPVKPSAT